MKKIYLFLILALMCVGVSSVKAQVTVGDFTYMFYNSGAAYITAYSGSETALTIPATVTYNKSGVETTVNVAGFGPGAFENNTTIEKVYLPRNASYTIGERAFKGCTALNTIAYSYSGVSATLSKDNQICMPTGTLAVSVFEGCTAIQEVYARYYMSGGIGANAFKGCTSLTTATLSANCASIGESAFEGCTALITVKGCSYKNGTNYYSCTIGNKAFKDCTALKFFGSSTSYAYLGGNGNTHNFSAVTSIGDNAFENCTSFTTAYFHRVHSIGANAFKGCTGLQYVYVVKADGSYNVLKSGDTDIAEITLGESAFEGCTKLVRIYYVSFSVDPNDNTKLVTTYQPNTLLTTIPARAFYGCEKFNLIGGTGSASTTSTSTTLYNGVCIPNVTAIGESAFEGCAALSLVFNLNASAPTIGANAFKNCVKLTRFGTQNNRIEVRGVSVGANAFENCPLPTQLMLSADCASIGASAFAGCSALASIYLYKVDTAPTVGEDAFTGIKANSYFYLYPTNSYKDVSKYALDDGWKVFFDGTKGSHHLCCYVNKTKQYGTISCDVPLSFNFASIAHLYKVTATSDSYAHLEVVNSKKLPANTGAVMEVATQTSGTNAGKLYTSQTLMVIFDGSESAAAFSDNLLVANVDENTNFIGHEGDTWNLIMNDGKFVKATDGTLAAGLAYLPREFSGSEAPELALDFEGSTTGITSMDNGQQTIDNGAWYTLNGVQLNGKPAQKGVYIHNGKKVVVK